MSGYLLRLAHQALGVGPAIRPLTPPRFPPVAQASDGPEVSVSAPAATPATLAPPPEFPPMRAPAHAPDAPPSATIVERPAPGATPAERPQRTATPIMEESASPTRRPLRPVTEAALAQSQEPSFERQETTVRPRAAPIEITPIASRTLARSTPSRAATGAAPRRGVEPPPPPDVHIHIGRIELTAPSTPAAPPRTPAPVVRSGLDDYLRRSERKRP